MGSRSTVSACRAGFDPGVGRTELRMKLLPVGLDENHPGKCSRYRDRKARRMLSGFSSLGDRAFDAMPGS